MNWNGAAAVSAGLAGTAVMTAIMYMGLAMMPRQMPMNIMSMMGKTMSRSTMPVYVMGATMHFGLGIMFGLVHTALYSAFGLESGLVVWGILFGLVHWMIADTAWARWATCTRACVAARSSPPDFSCPTSRR